MKFLTLVTPDLGISLLKMKFLTLVTSDLGISLVKMKFLSCAYVVGGGWELFAFLDNSRSMITLNPTPPP